MPNSRPRVGVAGGSGYTGLELLSRLADHPGVEVVFATARSDAGHLSPVPGLNFEDRASSELGGIDLLFCCLPHGAAVEWVQAARAQGVRVIDLTADFRPGSGREGAAVYGMVERTPADEVAAAPLVANPGCYPTGVILALGPLLDQGLIDLSRPVSVTAASGVTGAGRSPKRALLFAEVFGDYRAYSLGNEHRHLLEMRHALPGVPLLFIPHLLPVARGILETITLPVADGFSAADVRAVWQTAYRASPLVRVCEQTPGLADVANSDELHLSAFDNAGLEQPTLTLVVALDNLGKGAAGQAVQNMNLMLGLTPDEGLRRAR